MPDFDLRALHAALDEERQRRGLTWAVLTHEITGPVPAGHRSMSVSSFSGMSTRRGVNGNIVMAALRWLDRTPESFIPGHPDAAAKPRLPPDLPPRFFRRWNLDELARSIDARRGERPWTVIAREIGVAPATLRSYSNPDRFVSFPDIMRVTQWLNRPLTDFITRG